MSTDDNTVPDPRENNVEGYDPTDTRQALAPRAPKYKFSDADQMRKVYGIPKLEVDAFTEQHENGICYPDMLIHEKSADRTKSNKGTDGLFRGQRDSGKTTMAMNLAVRLMDENDERVIWRGRAGGSGWLPLRQWTTVYLPSGVDIDARWMDDNEIAVRDAGNRIDDLETVVRDVVYYDGIYDLLETLGERPAGTFNVVYPDPLFRDCEEITRETDRGQFAGGLPFTPKAAADEDTPPTPLTDWWVPFLIGRAEYGPFEWTSWICDEAGDLFPEEARNDEGRPLHDLIDLLRATWATSRKRFLSLFMFVHYEENLHHKLRREFKWRVCMPDGSSNPVSDRYASHPIGFKGDIPMHWDIMSDKDTGVALCYTKSGFTHFQWQDISPPDDHPDANRWLSIRPGREPGDSASKPRGKTAESTAPDDGSAANRGDAD